MKEIFINKARTAAVTGHRILGKDFDRESLRKTFYALIEGGYEVFLVGMALGFDTECFLTLEEIRKNKPVKIIACIPCIGQDEKFNAEQKELYKRMISSADEKVVLSENYTENCMMKRNKYMVDNCSLLVSYKRRESGGTAATVNYAKKQNVKILEI